MKKVVGKLILLAAIVSGICFLLTGWVLPAFWPRPNADVKVTYWKEHQAEYNTIFIGSSRVSHQIMPGLFDSLCKSEDIDVRSFNMAIPSQPFPQSYFMLKEVLNSKHVRYVFFEITPVYLQTPEKLLNTPESYYWYDWSQTALLCRQIQSNDTLPTAQKLRLQEQHVLNLMEKNYFVGGAQNIFENMFTGEREWVSGNCRNSSGYTSLDLEMKNGPDSIAVRGVRKNFLKDTTVLNIRRKEAIEYTFKNKVAVSTPYSVFLHTVCDEFAAKGIQLYFVIPPRMGDYDELNKVLGDVPPDNIIDLSSPERYPEFYLSEYAFDKGHLNTRGARIFTRELFRLSLGDAERAGTR